MKQKETEVLDVKNQLQSFTLLKNFETEYKKYKVGDLFSHSNEKVINYLKTNKYI